MADWTRLKSPALNCSTASATVPLAPVKTLTPPERTASIEPGGKTVYVDDIAGQIDLTMRVVKAILEQRDMTWSDVTRAIAYFKSDDFHQACEDYCHSEDMPDMPTIITENDVCRHDLLFEIELDAIA